MASLQSNTTSGPNIEMTTKLYSCLPESLREKFSSWMATTDPWRHFQYSKEECELKLSSAGNEYLVAQCNDQAVGLLVCSRNGALGGPQIHYVVVEESIRSQGIGKKLIQQILDESGDMSVYLTVSESNSRAKMLYEQIGFQQIGAIPDYNFQGEAEFIMRFPGRPKREGKSNTT